MKDSKQMYVKFTVSCLIIKTESVMRFCVIQVIIELFFLKSRNKSHVRVYSIYVPFGRVLSGKVLMPVNKYRK